MTGFLQSAAALAAVLFLTSTSSADAHVGSGSRCFRQNKCNEFKISSCSYGNREVCIWWNSNNEGCDKFWSQPFPDMCIYKPAETDEYGYEYKAEVKGVGKFSWRYGWARMVSIGIVRRYRLAMYVL